MRRRDLLRTAGAGTAAAVAALAGCGGEPPADCPGLPVEPNYRGYLDGVSNYRHTCDYRDEESVTVEVGVQGDVGFFKFGPPAVAVSPGTEVVWTWTGRGGAHNVVAERGTFRSGDPIDEDGHTFASTFDEPAVYPYYCEPHRSQEMKGAVFVALDEAGGP